VITWVSNRDGDRDIYAQHYSRDGSLFGASIKVNDDSISAYQSNPSISTDRSGNFVIAWEDHRNGYSDIYAQRYSSGRKALKDNFKVNDDEESSGQGSSCISSDECGNFVIAWIDRRDGHRGIYAQRYSHDGSPLGINFKVNNVNGVGNPSISSDGIGDFVITWKGDGGIYSQRYFSDGNAYEGNFLITKSGREPDIAIRNGRIYTTWVDNRDNGTGDDVWANVLDWDNPVGINEKDILQIPSDHKLSQNYPNPFNPVTIISYQLSMNSNVALSVYNLLGQNVATLVSEKKVAGYHEIVFNGENLSSGVYVYKIEVGEWTDVKKMILLH